MFLVKHILCKSVVCEGEREGGSDVALPGNRVGLDAKMGSTMNILNLKNNITHSTVI